jgi:hypothetical protein
LAIPPRSNVPQTTGDQEIEVEPTDAPNGITTISGFAGIWPDGVAPSAVPMASNPSKSAEAVKKERNFRAVTIALLAVIFPSAKPRFVRVFAM